MLEIGVGSDAHNRRGRRLRLRVAGRLRQRLRGWVATSADHVVDHGSFVISAVTERRVDVARPPDHGAGACRDWCEDFRQ